MTGFLQSYLFAWLFLLSIALGALANLMIHALTGGRWGEAVRPALAAATRSIPLVAVLFLPILLGAGRIYPWAAEPGRWLNMPFFAARSIAYLLVWTALAHFFLRGGRARRRIAAGGLVAYALTVSLAAVDWIGSLAPHWHSSGFGLVVAVGQMLAGLAFAVTVASFGRQRADAGIFNDLGNLLLMYVLTWAYLAYTQFLIIWAENLPREIAWYVPRVQTGWAALGALLIAFHFALPLLVLLSRAAKRAPATLGSIAAALLAAHAADVYWLVIPTFRPQGFAIAWTDLLAFAILGGAWLIAWCRALGHEPSSKTAAAHG